MSESVRPTLRCLRELGIEIPTHAVPLDSLAHIPIPQAQAVPEQYEAGAAQRILSLKDRVWFKVKTSRCRGAVVRLTEAEMRTQAESGIKFGLDPRITQRFRWWLGAAGQREAGSRNDFYASLENACSRAKSPTKPDGIDTDLLLPSEWDRKRLAAEVIYFERDMYRTIMLRAIARSLLSGQIIEANFGSTSIGALVRADRDEQFVAFIATNIFDTERLAVMMKCIPGISTDDWAPEPGGIANLSPEPGQIIWSALLPHEAADKVLELVPFDDVP